VTQIENINRRWRISFPIAAVLVPLVYALSSGPVLAIAFWLRQATRWEGFYAVMWLYYPLLCFGGPYSVFWRYIGWWCELFHTVGPG
jgi:hypothetical protein